MNKYVPKSPYSRTPQSAGMLNGNSKPIVNGAPHIRTTNTRKPSTRVLLGYQNGN